jgi:hypothetical protein
MTESTETRGEQGRKKHGASWWGTVLGIIGGVIVIYAFVAPAAWVKPQYLWAKPKPLIVTADAAWRVPSLGRLGTRQDTALVRIGGDQTEPALRELGQHLVVYWRLSDTSSGWQLGLQTGLKSVPASLPISVMQAGPWEMDLTVSCPADFSGVIELRPVLVSGQTFATLAVNRRNSARAATPNLPSGGYVGNGYLVETAGVTPGQSPSPYRQIGQLSANVTIDRFRSLLGPETARSSIPSGVEYHFITSEYYVQALANSDGRIAWFSVTTLSNSFRPRFGYWHHGTWHTLTLGATTFSQVGTAPSKCYAWVLPDRSDYVETYSLGAAGSYETMCLADNYLGCPRKSATAVMPARLSRAHGVVRDEGAADVQHFRATTVINTFGFSAPTKGNLLKPIHPKSLWVGPTAWDVGSVAANEGPAQSQTPGS